MRSRETTHFTTSRALVSSIQQRMTQVADRVKARPRPRVAVLEWTDPSFAPGHWIPEMVWLAGGDPVIGAPGAASRRISWDDVKLRSQVWWWLLRAATTGRVRQFRPTDWPVAVFTPCGSGRCGGCERVVGRPGTRLVDGIEELADFLHPARDQAVA